MAYDMNMTYAHIFLLLCDINRQKHHNAITVELLKKSGRIIFVTRHVDGNSLHGN